MTSQEVIQTINAVSALNPDDTDVQDQLKFFSATLQFAEQIKPLVVKYANKMPKDSNFLLKL